MSKTPWAAAGSKTGDSASAPAPAAAPPSESVKSSEAVVPDAVPAVFVPEPVPEPMPVPEVVPDPEPKVTVEDDTPVKPPTHVRMYREFPSTPDGPTTADVALVDVPEWEQHGWSIRKNW